MIKARRFGTPLISSLDSVVEILVPDGKVLSVNDDANGKDAATVFTPTVDGDYIVRVRHLNNAGGPTAIYYLEIEEDQPDFTLRCDPDKAMIGPGSGTAWFVHLARNARFAGPVDKAVRPAQLISMDRQSLAPTPVCRCRSAASRRPAHKPETPR